MDLTIRLSPFFKRLSLCSALCVLSACGVPLDEEALHLESSSKALAVAAPSLGAASTFSVLGASTVTCTNASSFVGDVGVSPGTAITGFQPDCTLTGSLHAGDEVAALAHDDAVTAYNGLTAVGCEHNLTGQDLGGMTLAPGVYCFDSSVGITGELTLDGGGNGSAVWVFQVGSTITTASNSAVVMSGNGKPCNVFWQVGSSATIGTHTAMKGNILASASITLTSGASLVGRALALNAAVTSDHNTVSLCDTTCDTTAPVITCPAERIVAATSPEGAFVTPANATVASACGATVSGPVARIYPPGTTTVTYTATDAAGNSDSCTTDIHVVVDDDATSPDLTMCNMQRYTSAARIKACGWATSRPGGAAISTVLLTIDGGAPLRLTPDAGGGFVIHWMELAEGHHTLTLTAIGTDGGITSQSMAVTVDRTAPVVRVLAPAPDDAQPFVVTIVSEVTDLTPVRVTANWASITDVPAGTNIATNTATFSSSGDNVVLVRATDAAGNTSEQVVQVLVQ
jgi:hypothetical protein